MYRGTILGVLIFTVSALAIDQNKGEASKEASFLRQEIEKTVVSVLPVTLESFLQSLQDYRPTAYWITKDFMELSIQEFEMAWKTVMDIITWPEQRWFYFCDKEQDYSEEQYWLKFLVQCQCYDAWLTQTYVDLATGELLYKEEAAKNTERATSLIQYWDLLASMTPGAEQPYVPLYAFFVDCLSYFFCQSVDNAHQSLSDTATYNLCIKAAKICLNKINKYMEKLKSSKLFPVYQLTIKKYPEILELLEHEQLKQLVGELYG
jgi:hypothetical protein